MVLHQVRGTLVEEFPLTRRTPTSGARRADAIILPSGEHRIATADEVEIDGEHIIVVQTKVGRMGMYLMGQAVFSPQLLLHNYQPARVRSVALCPMGRGRTPFVSGAVSRR